MTSAEARLRPAPRPAMLALVRALAVADALRDHEREEARQKEEGANASRRNLCEVLDGDAERPLGR